MRLRVLVALAALLALVALAPAAANAGARERSMLGALNAARAAQGAAPVRLYRPLTRTSRRYAAYMVEHNRWGHAANPARGTRVRYVGEILGQSTSDDAPSLVEAWLGSPAHRPILLDARYRYVGIGLSHGTMNGVPAWVWVVRFGAR
jgi:uncharacterized protein YkwD